MAKVEKKRAARRLLHRGVATAPVCNNENALFTVLEDSMPAKLKKRAGPVYIRIFGGFANQIAYDLYLEDAPDQYVAITRRQTQNPGTYLLSPDPAPLDRDTVLWGVDVVSPSTGQNQHYSVTIEIVQGGHIVPGGKTVDQGQFDGVTVVTGMMGLEVS